MKNTIKLLHNTLNENTTVVLGLSGGPDSMCLFHMLNALKEKKKIKIIVAHINHNVRTESIEEEKFVKKACKEHDCIFETIQLNFKTDKNFESLARKERYAFFNKIVNKYHAKFLLTAHHGDDLMETILMHITRGSNLKGYAGFKAKTIYPHYELLRPLIYMTKKEILEYCLVNKIEYCLDKSNESDVHTRNRYRKNILPFLKQENHNVHQQFFKFSEELELVEDYLERITKNALTRVCDFGKVNLHELNQLDLLIKKRVIEYILKEEYQDDICYLNKRHLTSILNMCVSNKPNMSIKLPLKKTIVKEYNTIYFYHKDSSFCSEYIVENEVVISDFERMIKLKNDTGEKSNFIVRLNSEDLAFPLHIRTRKEKDKMQIKNLNGTKKVKDIFIDEKVPKSKRDSIPILVDNNDNILWILGLKKSKFDKNKDDFYDIIYKYVISKEQKNEKK